VSRNTIYLHHSYSSFAFLLLIFAFVAGLIFFKAISAAFMDVGLSSETVIVLLIATLIGSFINIPVTRLKASVPIVTNYEFVSFFGMTYRIPRVEVGEASTLLAVNVGGAVIPSAISFYLLSKSSASTVLYSAVGVIIVALITHFVAKPVKGVGIATPAFIPPLAAVFVAIILPSANPNVVAYVAGVLGTLIGADLANLGSIPELGAPVASIGGAGTFDGVFLSGIIAVLLL